ncbi:hypothetical protein KCU65_g6143, partial [Aureobasidium melanogenum]
MDLRQFLIAPHERIQRQPLRQGTSDVFTSSEHQPQYQWQSQQTQHQNHATQHDQKPQYQPQEHQSYPQNAPCAGEQHNQFQPHHHSQDASSRHGLTRDQVLQGLAEYPDILASLVSQMRGSEVESVAGMQSQVQGQSHGHGDDGNRGFGSEDQSSRSSLVENREVSSHSASRNWVGQENPAEERQRTQRWVRRSESRASATTGNATILMIPTSPRAGRYAKGQRLPRQGQYQRTTFAQGQGQGYRSPAQRPGYKLSGSAGVGMPIPASFTLKRKAPGSSSSSNPPTSTPISSSTSWTGNTPIRDGDTNADAPSFPHKKARKSDMTNKQRSIDGASELLGKSTGSFTPVARSVDGSNEDFDTDLDGNQDAVTDTKDLAKNYHNNDAPEDLVRGPARDFDKQTNSTHLTDLTEDPNTNHTANKPNKPTIKKSRQTQKAHHTSLTSSITSTTPPLPSSTSKRLYKICSQRTKTRGVKASELHNKVHATCFAWYHNKCPKKKGKYCKYLHALTEPPSYVQPPRGYVHAGEEARCKRDWCPGDWMWDHDLGHGDSEDGETEGEKEVKEGEVDEEVDQDEDEEA